MKITREQLKSIVKETMIEENEYQAFFKKALEKTGKSIPQMSDEEKKAFFNKIDAAWKGKGEKNERFGRDQVGPAFGDEYDSKGEDCGCDGIEDLDESVNEGKKRFNTRYGVGKSKYVVNYHDGVKKHKDGSDFFDIKIFKNKSDLEAFKKDLVSKGFVKESVNEASGPKFKKGDMVNYIPKLSGLNPKKKLEIIRARYDDGDNFTSKGWYYSFKGTNLSANEKDIKLAESVNEAKFKKGDKVIVDNPWGAKPIKGVIDFTLKTPKGDVYVLKGDNGVWDEKYISLQ